MIALFIDQNNKEYIFRISSNNNNYYFIKAYLKRPYLMIEDKKFDTSFQTYDSIILNNANLYCEYYIFDINSVK